jgi:hypothetical protein
MGIVTQTCLSGNAARQPGSISETVSKRRGRPTAFDPSYLALLRPLYPDVRSERQLAAKAYEIEAVSAITKDGAAVDGVSSVFTVTGIYRATILEQLGRLKAENGWADEDTIHLARLANDRLEDGRSVREVVALLKLARRACRQQQGAG